MPRAGIPGVQGFPTLGPNEHKHLKDGTTVLYLAGGYETIVDTEDYPKISGRRWCRDSEGYAASSAPLPSIRMHRVLMGGEPKRHIDHENRNKLDNRKVNLRWATFTQNFANKEKTTGKSHYKGVCWDERRQKWRATIKVHGEQIWLGYFLVEEDAAHAYNNAALEYFGEFARINPLPI